MTREPMTCGGCGRLRHRRGAHFASMEHQLWQGMPTSRLSDECWEWTAGRAAFRNGDRSRGYGATTFKVDGRRLYAHQLAHLVLVGPIPDGLWVLHRCDNPPCINPNHLWLGTRLDNIRDRGDKGRTRNGRTGPIAREARAA